MPNRCPLCQCESCSPLPAPTWTVAHARACEARYVAAMGYHAREDFYTGVRKHRGEDGLQALKERVKREQRRGR